MSRLRPFMILVAVIGRPDLLPAQDSRPAARPPVRVVVLAGQSNMEGQAVVDLSGKDYNDGKGTLAALANDPLRASLAAPWRDAKGAWKTRDDVFVRYQREERPLLKGPLGFGFSVYGDLHHFGPELEIGRVLGDRFEEPILLVKTAWGGKSLAVDFRPPGAGGETGPYYKKMIAGVRAALVSYAREFKDLADRPAELSGFIWYQGWNDGCDPEKAVPEYEANLVHLIADVRREFEKPHLPFVVGELTGPWKKAPGAWDTLRRAQRAATERPEFKGDVAFVETKDFVRPAEDSPNPGHGHHEFGNAETYLLVGRALGEALVKLLDHP